MHRIYANLRNLNSFELKGIGWELSVSGENIYYLGEYSCGDGYNYGDGKGNGKSDCNVHCLPNGDGDLDCKDFGHSYDGEDDGGGGFIPYLFCIQESLVEL